MQSFGYSNQEILDIQKQITSISYSPMEEICNVLSIYALSAHDMVVEVPKYASKGFRGVTMDAVLKAYEKTLSLKK